MEKVSAEAGLLLEIKCLAKQTRQYSNQDVNVGGLRRHWDCLSVGSSGVDWARTADSEAQDDESQQHWPGHNLGFLV